MQTYQIILIIIAALVAVFALLYTVAAVTDKIAFGKRRDPDPSLKYFSADRYGLSARPVEITRGKNVLRGFVYCGEKADRRKLIIFCHGMGPGHSAYMTEIAYFCKLGYKVLAIDSTGCNISDGKSIVGMYEGIRTAVKAIDFASADETLRDMPVCLIGHSWGAYSVLGASAERRVDRVVAISAFNSPSRIVQYDAAAVVSRPFAAVLRPFWWIVNLFKFGRRGNAKAAKCAETNGAKTLLIQGDNDKIVPVELSAYAAAVGGNITKLLSAGKAHNPYASAKADSLMAELIATTIKVTKTEKDREFFRTFDYEAATQEDGDVMRAIAEFIA